MHIGKRLRVRRLFRNERSFVIPFDHTIYSGPTAGLEDPRILMRRMRGLPITGVLVGPGTLETIAWDLGTVGVILRLDGTHSRLGSQLKVTRRMATVEDAVRLGADAVVLNVFVGAENEAEHLEKLGKTATECRREGMPLVGEMIPAALVEKHYGRDVPVPPPDERAEMIGVAARIGAELGADLLKINYSGTPDGFRRVVESAMRPVLIAGGVKSGDDESFLRDLGDAVGAGAVGAIVGRNVWQREDVESMVLRAAGRIWED